MIQIKNVTKTYNGTVRAVDNLNLTVNNGEIVGFIGPNGAGKTTTLKGKTSHWIHCRQSRYVFAPKGTGIHEPDFRYL